FDNLRLTTERNTEQDWLKTNLAKFTNMLQGQRDLDAVGRLMLSELAPLVDAHQAVIYRLHSEDEATLRLLSVYADSGGAGHPEIARIAEDLLQQSQKLAGELQSQQGELQQTNEQLEQKATELAQRNTEVERKNQEIEQARRAVEEKATELALTSRYKSEFLANMSHELR